MLTAEHEDRDALVVQSAVTLRQVHVQTMCRLLPLHLPLPLLLSLRGSPHCKLHIPVCQLDRGVDRSCNRGQLRSACKQTLVKSSKNNYLITSVEEFLLGKCNSLSEVRSPCRHHHHSCFVHFVLYSEVAFPLFSYIFTAIIQYSSFIVQFS